jgi:formate/nitrite transporter FocA (FNT family)
MSAQNKIFYEGALSGIFVGIAVKAGLSLDQTSLPAAIYNAFCQATKNIQPAFNCRDYIIALTIIAVAMTLLTFVQALNRTDNRAHAALLYGISFFFGLIITILFI